MNARFRLGAVLRARQGQEDAAKAALVSARAEAAVAATGVRSRERDLDGRPLPDTSSATAFAAALSARHALAGALCAAIGVAELAAGGVQDRVADLTEAAMRRRILELLEERHTEARRRADDRAEQGAVDELSTAAHARRVRATR